MLKYFARLQTPKIILWCYLLWYLATVWFNFDPNPEINVAFFDTSGFFAELIELKLGSF